MLKVNNRTMKKLIYFQIMYILIINFFISEVGIPWSALYLCDVINVFLILFVFGQFIKVFYKIKFLSPLCCILFLSIILLIGIIINSVRLALVIWAIRNTYRFFIFFVACICILEKEDIDNIFSLLCKLQVVNIIISAYQYLIMGKTQDNLGGVFGTNSGCNAMTNIFFCILLIYVICSYIYRKSSLRRVMFVCFSTILIAALAELKIFYIEFVIIIVLSLLFSKPSKKMFIIVGCSSIGIIIGLQVLKNIYVEQYMKLTNISALWEYNSNVIWGYNISRFGAFREINQIFFKNDKILNLFGYGFGNCEMSSISMLTSDFYNIYGEYNYRWFAHQMWFLESGYLGFILFVCFFISIFIHSMKIKSKLENGDSWYAVFVQVLVVIITMNLWYNQAIRIEIAYLIFWGLSCSAIVLKTNLKKMTCIQNNNMKC